MAQKSDNPLRTQAGRPKIDVNNQLAARRAIQSILHSQRVAVLSRRFHGGGEVTSIVRVDGKDYEVDALRYEQLQSGVSPEDLDLHPSPGDLSD